MSPIYTNNRQQLIRLIHVAKRDLNLDDDSYRAILLRIGGKNSAAELTVSALDQVLQHLKSAGFKVRHASKKTGTGQSRALADDAQSGKIRALWLALHNLGAVRSPEESALTAYIKRMTGAEALQWLSTHQASTVIETLKKWQLRIEKERKNGNAA